jgi:hypothetical protein
MKRSQGPKCMTGVSYFKKAEQRLEIGEDYTFCRESYGQRFWDCLKESYSLIFWQNDKPSTQLIIRTFLKIE